MKKLLLTAFAFLSFAGPSFADTIHPSQALVNQGNFAVVEGTAHVHDTAAGVEIDVTDSNNGQLAAVIPAQAKALFSDLSSYDGKTVDVTGVIEGNQGRPTINLTHAKQLKLVSP